MYTRIGFAIAIAGAMMPAFAHHPAAVYYDMGKQVAMSGKVTEFRMGNPHARIYFDVTGADGTTAQ